MNKEINIINLKSGRKQFYTKFINETEKEIKVQIESKEGRIGYVTIPKAEIESMSEWESLA